MEIVVKFIIVLTVATVAAISSSKPAQNGLKLQDPKIFNCNQASPTSKPPVFSTTTPHVALTHIFCGEIKEGEVKGFHSRHLVDTNSKRQNCARTIGSITCNRTTCPKWPFSAEGIKLAIKKEGKYIYKSRKAKENQPQTFFPDDWDPLFIEKLAQNISDHCMSNSMLENGKACLKDYKFPTAMTALRKQPILRYTLTNIILPLPTLVTNYTSVTVIVHSQKVTIPHLQQNLKICSWINGLTQVTFDSLTNLAN